MRQKNLYVLSFLFVFLGISLFACGKAETSTPIVTNLPTGQPISPALAVPGHTEVVPPTLTSATEIPGGKREQPSNASPTATAQSDAILFLSDQSISFERNCPSLTKYAIDIPFYFFSLSTMLSQQSVIDQHKLSLGLTGFGGSNSETTYPLIPLEDISSQDSDSWITWPTPPKRATPTPPAAPYISNRENFPESFQFAIDQLTELEGVDNKTLIVVTDGILGDTKDFTNLESILAENELKKEKIHVHVIALCPQSMLDKWRNLDPHDTNDWLDVHLATDKSPDGGMELQKLWTPEREQEIIEKLFDQTIKPAISISSDLYYYGWLGSDVEIKIPGFARDFNLFVVSLEQKHEINAEQAPSPFTLSPNKDVLTVKQLDNLWEFNQVGENAFVPLSQCRPRSWTLHKNIETTAFYFYRYSPVVFSNDSSLQFLNQSGKEFEGNKYLLKGTEAPKFKIVSQLVIDNFKKMDYEAFAECYSMYIIITDSDGNEIDTTSQESLSENHNWLISLDNLSKGELITAVLKVIAKGNEIESEEVAYQKLSIVYTPQIDANISYYTSNDDESGDSFKLSIKTEWRGGHVRPLVRFISENSSEDCVKEKDLKSSGNERILEIRENFELDSFISTYTVTVSRRSPGSPNVFNQFLKCGGYFLITWPEIGANSQYPRFECKLPESFTKDSANSLLSCVEVSK